ncbi:MAG: hypothetical protein LAO18_08895 [Acidobacteriia bacterium]|nr:hypothetical protein [Terriglobia bacterium]
MSGTVQKEFRELGRQVSEKQARTLVELVIDVLNTLDEQRHHAVSKEPQSAVVERAVKARRTS